jgi:hypothetical protein
MTTHAHHRCCVHAPPHFTPTCPLIYAFVAISAWVRFLFSFFFEKKSHFLRCLLGQKRTTICCFLFSSACNHKQTRHSFENFFLLNPTLVLFFGIIVSNKQAVNEFGVERLSVSINRAIRPKHSNSIE